jgi:rhodanese-related sulfurtransferase/protein-L-isoaspartate O-methyltransferase
MNAPFGPSDLPLLAAANVALLDVRRESEFAAGHLPGSGHLPASELLPRRAELPPRDAPVAVLGADSDEARHAALELEAMGYRDVRWLDAPLAPIGAMPLQLGPPARLWRPAPFLIEVLDAVPRGKAVDLAAGSGREAAYLAERGFDVEAWDAAPEALERAADLARRSGSLLTTVVADLEAQRPPLPEARFALITCFRFLSRRLFPAMARALTPGGHLVYETYRVGQERFGRPKRAQYLLEDGELARAFETLGLEVLRFEEPSPEDGPITARLWAKRPA